MIDREVELNLHQLLLEDDPAAPSMCWQLFFTPLTRILRRIHPEEHDDHLFEEAALTALNEYIRTPSKYQPERRSLLGYVVMAARRDLLTLIERERRQT